MKNSTHEFQKSMRNQPNGDSIHSVTEKLILIGVIVGWILLQTSILPRFGVAT